jgi:hypothetical protein
MGEERSETCKAVHLFVVMGFSPSNVSHTSGYAHFLNTFRNRHITQTAEAVYYKLSTCS